jgi:hypothetical protein
MLDVMCDVASSIGDIPVAAATPSAAGADVDTSAEIVETAANAGTVATANDDAVAAVDTSAITAGGDKSVGASSLSPQSSVSEHSQKKQTSHRQPKEEDESSSSSAAKKRRKIDIAAIAAGEVDDEAASHYGSVVHTPGSFRIPMQQMQQQQQTHYHMMSRNPHAYSQQQPLMPQYHQPREAHDVDDDGGDGRLHHPSFVPNASGFFVPAVAHKPVAYPPLPRQGEYPMAMAMSPRGPIHSQQQAMMAAAAMAHHQPWQHHPQQQMMMMTPGGHVMMPPTAGVYSPGYVQLQQYQLMVPQQQQQLMMSHMNAPPSSGYLPDQRQLHAMTTPSARNRPPSLFPDDVVHYPGGGWAYSNAPSSSRHPGKHQAFPSQHQQQHQHDNVDVDASVASGGQLQQQCRQQPADTPSPHAANAAAQRLESPPKSPTPPPSPSWKRRGLLPPEVGNSNGRKPSRSNVPVVVHQPAPAFPFK